MLQEIISIAFLSARTQQNIFLLKSLFLPKIKIVVSLLVKQYMLGQGKHSYTVSDTTNPVS
jgi:hypothetical protein